VDFTVDTHAVVKLNWRNIFLWCALGLVLAVAGVFAAEVAPGTANVQNSGSTGASTTPMIW